MVHVSQESPLGSLGMEALSKRYCGPNFSLEGLDLNITKVGENISVTLYDMTVGIGPKNPLYTRLNEVYAQEVDKQTRARKVA
jgi:hypothetical protein